MNGLKTACVWVEEINQWVTLSKVDIIQFYQHEGNSAVQFKYNGKVFESYIEYKEL